MPFAGDAAYAASQQIGSLTIVHSWSDLLPPINLDGSSIFKLGSTVPVKFRLTAASAAITNLGAKLTVAKLTAGIVGTELESTSTSAADSGNTFRYDAASDQYVYNLSTKSLSQGSWQLKADLLDGVVHTVTVSLKK